MTAAEIQELHDAWHAAELAVATGQSYQIGSRNLTRADATFIVAQHAKYHGMLEALSGGGSGGARAFGVIPRDV